MKFVIADLTADDIRKIAEITRKNYEENPLDVYATIRKSTEQFRQQKNKELRKQPQ